MWITLFVDDVYKKRRKKVHGPKKTGKIKYLLDLQGFYEYN